MARSLPGDGTTRDPDRDLRHLQAQVGLLRQLVVLLREDVSAEGPGVQATRVSLEKQLAVTLPFLGAVLVSVGQTIAVPQDEYGLNLDLAIDLVEEMDQISGHLPELIGVVRQLGWAE